MYISKDVSRCVFMLSQLQLTSHYHPLTKCRPRHSSPLQQSQYYTDITIFSINKRTFLSAITQFVFFILIHMYYYILFLVAKFNSSPYCIYGIHRREVGMTDVKYTLSSAANRSVFPHLKHSLLFEKIMSPFRIQGEP